MKWKMLGLIGRPNSTKEGVSKVFSSIRAIGMRGLNASFDTSEDPREPKGLNLRAYIAAKQRMQEIEGQKALAISLSRHESWKAGGPV